MKSETAALRLVPQEDRLSFREEARTKVREELVALKEGSKEAATSRRLLTALEALHEKPGDPVAQASALEIVNARLGRLKRVNHDLEACQRRDLKIILFFAVGDRIFQDARQQACAILKLHGDEASIAEVCRVYPGLQKAFDE